VPIDPKELAMSENESETVEVVEVTEEDAPDPGLPEGADPSLDPTTAMTPPSEDNDPEVQPFQEPVDGGDPDSTDGADIPTEELDLEPADSTDHSDQSDDADASS
jgi:hypothetical protein